MIVFCSEGEHFNLTYLNKQPTETLWPLAFLMWGKEKDSTVDMCRGCNMLD